MRSRGAVRERLSAPGPAHPLPDSFFGDASFAPGASRRAPELEDLTHNLCSTTRRQPGILVDVHPGILPIDLACLATTSFDESPRMDNPPADDLVRLHT
jgi:hypothetical protein